MGMEPGTLRMHRINDSARPRLAMTRDETDLHGVDRLDARAGIGIASACRK
ncbi:hypothetical protein BCCR75502_03040 [Burkholderia sola]|nr:hypothetical protein BCCR75389_03025 [Burkholderia cenocepacia]CAG2296909.1 hypothetical protein BCCR75386_03041 [Burkholderia cenocepacia]CAG2297329.1 hypothetical protein BCCR75388_03043 [Burkholderia cenocepacia]CAG2297413.1 hypothetical protein BCCR75384_03040 [Burkholderia cenocepacia]CAG2297598.1 hypothetical protein BCCR75387_03040 [Burkholderia cenocepacia]